MIYYDATEARKRTRVKPSTLAIAQSCEGLEHHTGSDWLIDPLDSIPLPDKLLDIPPHMIALREHCQVGVLIQRKSGRDLLSSIAELSAIQARMSIWSLQVWLTPVGVTQSGETGVAIFGRKVKGWKWASVQGAFVAWRFRGGSVTPEVKTDADLTKFFQRIEFKVKEYYHDDTKTVAKKSHNQHVKLVERNWLNTLSAWPTGIGSGDLLKLAKHIDGYDFEPSLINVARFVLSGQAEEVKGWGTKMVNSCREWWGVDHDQPLDVIVVPLGGVGSEPNGLLAENMKSRRGNSGTNRTE